MFEKSHWVFDAFELSESMFSSVLSHFILKYRTNGWRSSWNEWIGSAYAFCQVNEKRKNAEQNFQFNFFSIAPTLRQINYWMRSLQCLQCIFHQTDTHTLAQHSMGGEISFDCKSKYRILTANLRHIKRKWQRARRRRHRRRISRVWRQREMGSK